MRLRSWGNMALVSSSALFYILSAKMLNSKESDMTNLLLQVPLSVFIIATGLLELFDASLLLFKLLVVASLFLDKTVDC